ncbi:MAG: hypothetical protein HZB65_00830 [Candidatus Aenigmarchaeota archaeon]|nr:hypothetical protein [Candidatus Aenigmarchaeota archaeon]
MDEFTAVIRPYYQRAWSIKGIRPLTKINYTREKFHVTGLLGNRSFLYEFTEKLKQEDFLYCLKKFLNVIANQVNTK